MAFRQPTYHVPQRIYTAAADETQNAPQPTSQRLEESQEWILFSPVPASTTDRTYTTSTDRTRTAGRSRISDFGSLDTAARSYGYGGSEAAVDDEEDGELDSLDSHLHEFRSEPSVYRRDSNEAEVSGTVLPTHDGLGSFRVDHTAMGEEVQEHLYAFERYNPRRMKRRRESVELVGLEVESERFGEMERTRRVEAWRIEQSRLLVDEIQRETRRRKQSMSSERRSILEDREQEDVATLSNVDAVEDTSEENESFWNRITRRVIRDLMGIDDDLLSIIFGESLPIDDDLSSTPQANPQGALTITPQLDHSSWEYRLLERIARELGLLVNQLSDHPGAFSTYLRTQQSSLPYAGLPAIPESSKDVQTDAPPQPEIQSQTQESSINSPEFKPTIPAASTTLASPTSALPIPIPQPAAPLSREEWERDLDIKMIFRYLQSRFTSSPNQSAPTPTDLDLHTNGTSYLATASTADSAARAARVRAQHPLIKHGINGTEERRRRERERRTWRPSVPGGRDGAGIGMRRSESCRSERLNGIGKGKSGSSRHYWDFGGSLGSGSLIASMGGMGSWGEV